MKSVIFMLVAVCFVTTVSMAGIAPAVCTGRVDDDSVEFVVWQMPTTDTIHALIGDRILSFPTTRGVMGLEKFWVRAAVVFGFAEAAEWFFIVDTPYDDEDCYPFQVLGNGVVMLTSRSFPVGADVVLTIEINESVVGTVIAQAKISMAGATLLKTNLDQMVQDCLKMEPIERNINSFCRIAKFYPSNR